MPTFNVADGSVATVLNENSPFALIKGYQHNTWFYAPRAARIAKGQDGRPLFTVARNRAHVGGGGGLDTLGGTFAAQIELAVIVPTPEEIEAWTQFITATTGIAPQGTATFTFQPMRLRNGVMTILGADAWVVDPGKLINVPVGASSTIPISLQLNALGADTFASALRQQDGQHAPLPVNVWLQYRYDIVVPNTHYRITANTQQVFDFFSTHTRAAASFWGLVGADADIQTLRQDLQNSGAIVINQISAPEGLSSEQVKQLEATIIDAWTKAILHQIAEPPKADPAVASDPGGFFGGVSFALKSLDQIQNLNLSAEFNFSQLNEDLFDLSYVFDPLFAESDAASFLIDVIDDNRLPITINITGDNAIQTYSGQFGYKLEDGTFVTDSIQMVNGQAGAVLDGIVQFPVGAEPPQEVDLQLSVDFVNPNWDDRTEHFRAAVTDSGVAFTYDPGNDIARMSILTDLEELNPGTISIIQWQSKIPDHDGTTSPIFSGSTHLVGQGPAEPSAPRLTEITLEFPYFESEQSSTEVEWTADINPPNGGDPIARSGSQVVTRRTVSLLKSALGV